MSRSAARVGVGRPAAKVACPTLGGPQRCLAASLSDTRGSIWSQNGSNPGRRSTVAYLIRAVSKGITMEALQKPGRIAGLWFIGTFVFSIPAVLLYDPVLNDANYILGGGLDARISLGALLEILLAISNIATAVVFFPY